MAQFQGLMSHHWLALMVGNSRLHWGYFQGNTLKITWDTHHLSHPLITNKLPQELLLSQLPDNLPLYFASVVPSQTLLWQAYPKIKLITLNQIPLNKLYPTLGIDRALAALGTGKLYGFPCLVMDAGTALTFTGIDSDHTLVGGAILPGLKLQFQTLASGTADLFEGTLPPSLPSRWATTTLDAIQSGIIHTILAGIKSFIQDWLKKFPNSEVIVTGGDSLQILNYFKADKSHLLKNIKQDSQVIFAGIRELVLHQQIND